MSSNSETIRMIDFPSMAAPWSTEGDGESWEWGNYLVTFQTKPKTVAEVLAKVAGDVVPETAMTYHYSCTVFSNPRYTNDTEATRPILSVGLEQMDVSKLSMLMEGILKDGVDVPNDMPIVLGVFNPSVRMNMGNYEGPVTTDACRSELFETIKGNLDIDGFPNKIGDITEIYKLINPNHPAVKRSNGGCLGILALMVFLPALLYSGSKYF